MQAPSNKELKIVDTDEQECSPATWTGHRKKRQSLSTSKLEELKEEKAECDP